MTLNEYAEYIKGKTVSVIGLGVSNMPLIRLLHRLGADIVARDRKTAEQLGEAYAELTALGVRTALGEGYLSDIKEQIIFRRAGACRGCRERLRHFKRNGAFLLALPV